MAEITPSEWNSRYEQERPKFEKLTNKLLSLLKEILEREGIKAVFESRTKDLNSFTSKISKPEKSYINPLTEVTDLSGVRIVLYSLEDVEKVVDILSREFEVDTEKSINKSDLLDPDKFGYLSQHVIVQVGQTRRNLPEWSDLSELWSEIQVRTVLQHSWATVEHFLVYKNEQDIPREFRRRLFRLSALFEMADEELNSLIKNIQILQENYKNQLNNENLDIEINVDALKAYIQTSDEMKFWFKVSRVNIGINIYEDDWSNLSKTIEVLQFFNYKSIKEIDTTLKSAHNWGETFLRDYLIYTWRFQNKTLDQISAVATFVVLLLTVGSNAEKIVQNKLRGQDPWDTSSEVIDLALNARGLK